MRKGKADSDMSRRKRYFALLFILSAPLLAFAQQPSVKKDEPLPIQDNSFLIEEAYNQEAGVVQHINSFARDRNKDWLYTFTQEWPVKSQKHQFSFTLPVQRAGSAPDGGKGISDIALNYRYQLINRGGGDSSGVAVAPRISLLLPREKMSHHDRRESHSCPPCGRGTFH